MQNMKWRYHIAQFKYWGMSFENTVGKGEIALVKNVNLFKMMLVTTVINPLPYNPSFLLICGRVLLIALW